MSIRRTGAEINDFKEFVNIWKPSQIKNKRFVKFSSLFTAKLFTVKLVPCFLVCCVKWTSSPLTSCQRLGLCLSTPSWSWWSWLNFRRLKIGRRSRARERKKLKLKSFINHQLIKDKIYLLEKIWTEQVDRETIWLIRAEL